MTTPSASLWSIIKPAAATNLITNPSFETVTTGWTTAGTNTIARSTTQQWIGAYSLACTYVDDITLASHAITLTAAAHYAQIQIYIPTAYPGTQVALKMIGFTSATGTITANADMTLLDQWQLVICGPFTPDAGDLSGSIRVQETGTPGAGTLYIDAAQCELTQQTTYLDGDMDGGYWWTGTPHASTSARDAQEASGGVLLNLSTDIGFIPSEQDGTGMPPVNNLSSPLALQPGELFEAQTIGPRTFSLTGTIVGTSASNFHSQKQELISALNPSTVKINQRSQPRTFRYTGAAVDKEITAVYDGGLERGLPNGMTEQNIRLRLRASDPLFYQVGNTGKVLDSRDSATFDYFAGKENGVWGTISPSSGGGTVDQVLAGPDGLIYICGNFTNWDGIANADYIVTYDPVAGAFAAVGTGADGRVRHIEFDAAGNLYAAGAFTNIGGVLCRGVGYWDGSAWNALGPPSSGGDVGAFAIDLSGNIYVGGSWTNWDGIAAADYWAVWSGSAWAAIGASTDAAVNDFAVAADGTLYIIGEFTTIGGVAANYIASYDGTTVSAMSTGLGGGGAIVEVAPNSLVFACGTFTTAGGVTVNYITYWNGQGFFALPTLFTSVGLTRMRISPEGEVWVLGSFLTGGATPTSIVIWNGSTWYYPDLGFSSGNVTDVTWKTGSIYIGLNSSYAATYAGATTITYTGTERAYPLITIERSGGTAGALYSIANQTTGAELLFNYTLQDGETLAIDCRPGQQSITSSIRGNVYADLLPSSDLGNFYLTPGNGSSQDNLITMLLNMATANITATMIYKTAYISED